MGRGAHACDGLPSVYDAMPYGFVEFISDRGPHSLIPVKIAITPVQRASGFQNVCRNDIENVALLFIFDRDVVKRFHMRNVLAPLDIAFFANDGELIGMRNMLPEKGGAVTRTYGIDRPYRFALEAMEGRFKLLLDGSTGVRLKIYR